MARWSEATWRPVKNHGGARPKGQPSIVVMHHAVMNGSLYNVFNGSRQASTDFWIAKDGRCEQYVDTAMTSWGNGSSTANQRGISVETEGCGPAPHAEPMTEPMINTFARLVAWANRTHGIPLRTTESYDQPGFGYHRMRGGPATACPCDVRKNMRSEILRRAQGQAPATPQPQPEPEDEEMLGNLNYGGLTYVFNAMAQFVGVTWQGKDGRWNAQGRNGAGYPAGFVPFAKNPSSSPIVAVDAFVNVRNEAVVTIRTKTGESFYTWLGGDGKWIGAGGGYHAAFRHFAAKP